jgi:hypothetical protein
VRTLYTYTACTGTVLPVRCEQKSKILLPNGPARRPTYARAEFRFTGMIRLAVDNAELEGEFGIVLKFGAAQRKMKQK